MGRGRAGIGRFSRQKICGPTTRRRGCACRFPGDAEVRAGCARVSWVDAWRRGRLRRARTPARSETPVQNRTIPRSIGHQWPRPSSLVIVRPCVARRLHASAFSWPKRKYIDKCCKMVYNWLQIVLFRNSAQLYCKQPTLCGWPQRSVEVTLDPFPCHIDEKSGGFIPTPRLFRGRVSQ